MGSDYCLLVHTSALQKLGLDDEGVVELLAVVDLFSGLNKLVGSLRIEPDEKPGMAEARYWNAVSIHWFTMAEG